MFEWLLPMWLRFLAPRTKVKARRTNRKRRYVLKLELLEERTVPATVPIDLTWVGTQNNSWINAANWLYNGQSQVGKSPQYLPEPGDNIYFFSGSKVKNTDVIMDAPKGSTTNQIGSLTIEGFAGTITIQSPLPLIVGVPAPAQQGEPAPALVRSQMNSGTIKGGNLVLAGNSTKFVWTGGAMNGPGNTDVQKGAELDIAPPPTSGNATSVALNSRTMNIDGQVKWTNGWIFMGKSTININSASGFQISGTPAYITELNDNLGKINVGENASLVFNPTDPAKSVSFVVALNNKGTVEVDSGTLSLKGGGTSSGTFLVGVKGGKDYPKGPLATLNFFELSSDPVSFNWNDGTKFGGVFGVVNVSGKVNIADSANIQSTLWRFVVQGGTVSAGKGSTFVVSTESGFYLVSGTLTGLAVLKIELGAYLYVCGLDSSSKPILDNNWKIQNYGQLSLGAVSYIPGTKPQTSLCKGVPV